MSKTEYVNKLKNLVKEEDDKIMRDSTSPFGCVPIEYPENFFDIFYEMGMDIEDAVYELTTPSL